MPNTTAVTYQPRWFQNQLLLPGAVALASMFWLAENGKLGIGGPLLLVLLAQLVLFLLLLRRPIWAMAALIVGQFTSSNYMLSIAGLQVSIRFLWAILALIILVPMLSKNGGIKLGSGARRIIIPAAIMVSVATVANLVNTDLAQTMQYLRMNVASLVILFLLPATIKNERDLKRLALVALITCSVSAIFALLQRLHLQGLLPLYELYENSVSWHRVSGLAESPVQLGFGLPLILLPMLAIYLSGGASLRVKKLLILLAAIMVAALFFTFTRSGIYSLIPGVLLMVLLMKGKPKKELFMVTLVLFAGFLFFVDLIGSRYIQGFTSESSAAGRLVLWVTGLDIALNQPILGIGANQFIEVSTEYAETIDPSMITIRGAEKVLGRYEAHNDFLTVWTSFGTVALLAYLWVFVGIFRNNLASYRKSPTPFLKALSLGLLASLVAYILNAATHNVMGSSMLLWILSGLSIATTKIALSQPSSQVGETR